MCGGYGFHGGGWQELRLTLGLGEDRTGLSAELGDKAWYAIRPFDRAPIVRATDAGVREVTLADQWSLLPAWSRTRRMKYLTFNARNDKLASAPTWRTPFRRQRCLVPAAGFFERVAETGLAKKRPYYVSPDDARSFCFAGLWDEWVDRQSGEILTSFTVVTSAANRLMSRIGHPRCPVILPPAEYDLWLDRDSRDAGELSQRLAQPWASGAWGAWKVGMQINDRRENGLHLTDAVGEAIQG